MPLTHSNWLSARINYEKLHLSDCSLLSNVGGTRQRCESIDGNLNVCVVWITQAFLLLVVLPMFCYRAVRSHSKAAPNRALQKLMQSHTQCCVDAYAIERILIPFVMLLYLLFAFISSLEDDLFTLFYFTFLTVSTQLICNTVLLMRANLEHLGLFQCSTWSTAVRIYSQIILVHTFACTTFIVAALLVFAFTNQKMLHAFFIYKLYGGSPTIIGNELIHTVPVLVYLFLIKTHYSLDVQHGKWFLASYVGDSVLNWIRFVVSLQIPSYTYIVLVDWNCVYGRLAKPFEDDAASAVAYIFIAIAIFGTIHSYVFRRVMCGPRCEEA